MTEVLALLQNIAPLVEKTTFRQMSQVIFGMLVVSGRITMLGLSRWTEKGGSYRTIQRFYHNVVAWNAIQWLFFRKRFLKPEDEYIVAGDEVVVSKAGKETHGLDRFFSGIQQRVIPSLSFFAFSLVNVREQRSYPLQAVKVVKSPAEKAASKAKVEAKKTAEKKKRWPCSAASPFRNLRSFCWLVCSAEPTHPSLSPHPFSCCGKTVNGRTGSANLRPHNNRFQESKTAAVIRSGF